VGFRRAYGGVVRDKAGRAARSIREGGWGREGGFRYLKGWGVHPGKGKKPEKRGLDRKNSKRSKISIGLHQNRKSWHKSEGIFETPTSLPTTQGKKRESI